MTRRPARIGCAAARLEHGEPLFGTAPERATPWLLVEHPGPWPAPGVPRRVPPEVARMWQAVGSAGVRCQWIRPVQDRRRAPSTVFLVGAQPGERWVERRTVDDLRELTELDVAALVAGQRPGFGATTDERVVLVCTHGQYDACCARFGRPAAVRLDSRLPGMVWETTHLGGHRFAANVVTLPDGSYHGGVTASDADQLADALLNCRVIPARLRGRAGVPAAVQAADYYARIRCGVHRLDGVVPLGHERVGVGGAVRVELEIDGFGRHAVLVRPRRLAGGQTTSCGAPGTTAAKTFDLVTFGPVPDVVSAQKTGRPSMMVARTHPGSGSRSA